MTLVRYVSAHCDVLGNGTSVCLIHFRQLHSYIFYIAALVKTAVDAVVGCTREVGLSRLSAYPVRFHDYFATLWLSCHSWKPLIVNNSVPEVWCWVVWCVFKLGCHPWEPFTVKVLIYTCSQFQELHLFAGKQPAASLEASTRCFLSFIHTQIQGTPFVPKKKKRPRQARRPRHAFSKSTGFRDVWWFPSGCNIHKTWFWNMALP